MLFLQWRDDSVLLATFCSSPHWRRWMQRSGEDVLHLGMILSQVSAAQRGDSWRAAGLRGRREERRGVQSTVTRQLPRIFGSRGAWRRSAPLPCQQQTWLCLGSWTLRGGWTSQDSGCTSSKMVIHPSIHPFYLPSCPEIYCPTHPLTSASTRYCCLISIKQSKKIP